MERGCAARPAPHPTCAHPLGHPPQAGQGAASTARLQPAPAARPVEPALQLQGAVGAARLAPTAEPQSGPAVRPARLPAEMPGCAITRACVCACVCVCTHCSREQTGPQVRSSSACPGSLVPRPHPPSCCRKLALTSAAGLGANQLAQLRSSFPQVGRGLQRGRKRRVHLCGHPTALLATLPPARPLASLRPTCVR